MDHFTDREQAGDILAEKLAVLKPRFTNPIVLGIPRGGVSVGYRISKELDIPLDIIVLRKLPVPYNPETGFGAVTLDKTVIFNEELMMRMNLSQKEINEIIDDVYVEVLRRNKVYRKNKPFPSLSGRSVILTDDGLATGFTMLAAVRFAKKNKAKEIIVAVPVAHRQSYELVKKEADKTIVLHVSDLPYFAVASFYDEFPDMSDKGVIAYLEEK